MTFPRTTSALKAALEDHGLRPRKMHGQCFLTDIQAVDAIVRDAGVRPNDLVVEVGTGPGILTNVLCDTGARIETFDIDARLQSLARKLREWPSRVRFHDLDVLASKHELAPAFAAAFEPPTDGRLLLVSNLPYSVATPVLLGVLGLPEPPAEITVMVQLEVAQKMLAQAGAPNYGAPSVLVGLRAEGELLRRFPPKVFWPRPKVHSALLRLTPRTPMPAQPDEHRPFGTFVTTLFTRRRKVLTTALRAAAPDIDGAQAKTLLEDVGIEPTGRVQEVDPLRLLTLWRAVRSRPAAG